MFAGNHSQNGVPFSIDAALSGTVSSYKAKPEPQIGVSTLEDSMPKGWMFEIHEDTIEEELGNLMEHSTCTLDISDDESRQAAKDDRGKENIPPLDYPASLSHPIATTVRAASRKDLMTDEPRSPLGDLDAREYYAEGCDSSSYYIIPAGKSNVNVVDEPVKAKVEVKAVASPIGTHDNTATRPHEGWKDFLAQIEESKKSNEAAAMAAAESTVEQEASIEIWESESAKGDGDIAAEDQPHNGLIFT